MIPILSGSFLILSVDLALISLIISSVSSLQLSPPMNNLFRYWIFIFIKNHMGLFKSFSFSCGNSHLFTYLTTFPLILKHIYSGYFTNPCLIIAISESSMHLLNFVLSLDHGSHFLVIFFPECWIL